VQGKKETLECITRAAEEFVESSERILGLLGLCVPVLRRGKMFRAMAANSPVVIAASFHPVIGDYLDRMKQCDIAGLTDEEAVQLSENIERFLREVGEERRLFDGEHALSEGEATPEALKHKWAARVSEVYLRISRPQ
jgi:hypothetical protein